MYKIATSITIALLTSIASAAPTNPYAAQQSREIKALSAQDIQGYLSGKGMGLAKAAELNGYPGPAHVMSLSSELDLTPQQELQSVTPHLLASAMARIGQLQGQFREAHLEAHITQAAILTPKQIMLYNKLRGYGDAVEPPHHHGKH